MVFENKGSKKIFDGKMLKVWLEQVLYPDGRQVDYEIIHHPGSVVILPIDDEEHIWFTLQYRHPVGGMLLELPAGTLEIGEMPEKCALREIREEIRMAAKSIDRIGGIYLAPGYSNEYMYVFVAKDLYPAPLEHDYGEYIEIKRFSVKQVYDLLEKGEILDGKTAAVLGMVRGKL
jgi:ADP-ribose pyrophosphatase